MQILITLFQRKYSFAVLAVILAHFTIGASACSPKHPEKDLFHKDPPIWVNVSRPNNPKVALFRHSFSFDTPSQESQLHIFADTRYEAWLDGKWLGRGPARFSKSLREYDIYELGNIDPGDHLLAVLVQWAPNFRRSESKTPLLMAHIQGGEPENPQVLTTTGSNWKSLLSKAWNKNATPVHTWKLIGPTELLDLRLIPENWNQPDFPDHNWSNAEVQPDQGKAIIYQPRSIPLLDEIPIKPDVIDSGWLSPDFVTVDLIDPDPFSLTFTATKPTRFTIEILSETKPSAGSIVLVGKELNWQEIGTHRPDVYYASVELETGSHELIFNFIPSQGIAFNVSQQDIIFENLPPQQGIHAGLRLLLSEPVSNSEIINYADTPNGMRIEFNSLPAYIVLDLGRTIHGRFQADVDGPSGSVIDIGWDEQLRTPTQRPLPYPGTIYPEWNQVDSWVLDGKSRYISTLDARAGRYILIAVWGESPIRLQNVRIFEERYPLTQVGEFNSSDALLDKIWQVGVDSLLPNMNDAYTDTPWRERAQWWGDAYVEERVNRIAFGDKALLKRGLVFMADALQRSPSPAIAPSNGDFYLLDYTMLWVMNSAQFLQETQDLDFANLIYPALSQFMHHLTEYENPETGLLDLPKKKQIQLAYIDTIAFNSRYGQSTALNSLYHSTLLNAADIADLVGKNKFAKTWRGRAKEIKISINANLYLPEEHRYLTTIYNEEDKAPSPHSQAWPLAFDIVPDHEIEAVTNSLLEMIAKNPKSPNVEIYGMFWVLEALGKTGHISQALDIIKLYYGHLLDNGATTWWETFNADHYPNNSWSHGWGSAPSWFLTTYVLGAKEVRPDNWILKPEFDSLDFASGILPLTTGVLQAHWKREDCSKIILTVSSSEGADGQIQFPLIDVYTQVTMDSESIWNQGTSLTDNVSMRSGEISISIDAGDHEIIIYSECP